MPLTHYHKTVAVNKRSASTANYKVCCLARNVCVLQEWDTWLCDTVTSTDMPPSKREAAFVNWKSAPSALFSHPREEHLLPLFVTAGAAGAEPGRVIWTDTFAGFRCSSYQWD